MSDDETRVRARLHDYAAGIEPIRDLPAVGRTRYRRRVRIRRTAAVLAAAIAVVGVVGAGVALTQRPDHLGFQTDHPNPGPTTVPATTLPPDRVAKGTASGLPLADTSWVSNDEGWALVSGALLHTTEGGARWQYVSAPPATVLLPSNGVGGDCSSGDCVSRVRFADRRHGYLFGRAMFTTSDGGATWTPDTSATVLALEVARGRAFRVVTTPGCFPPGCAYFVETAKVGSSSWARLATPAVVGDSVQLLYDGPRVYVATYGNPAGGGDAHIKLLRSLDAGRTWQLRSDPCGNLGSEPVDTASLAAAPGGFLVALCQPRGFDHGLFVTTSFDAGTTFGRLLPLPVPASAIGGGVAAGAASSIVVAVREGAKWVVLASDSLGASWRTTLTPEPGRGESEVAFLGFEDARTGRVALGGDHLWTTRDGGNTWTLGHP